MKKKSFGLLVYFIIITSVIIITDAILSRWMASTVTFIVAIALALVYKLWIGKPKGKMASAMDNNSSEK